jgi:hypothetical protein
LNPGTYIGRIIVWSENGGKTELPVEIKMRMIWWIPFILVGIGVIANLILSVNRWRLEEKKSAEAQILLAESEIYKAEDENRKDDRFTRAVNLQTEYQVDFNAGEYKAAKEKAIKAKFEAENAKSREDPVDETSVIDMLSRTGPIYEQTAPKIADSVVIDGVRVNFPTLILDPYEKTKPEPRQRAWILLKSVGLMYLTLTIIVGVVMLQAWQAFFPRISDFGASSIDYITAFLYGFSGQAFLSEFADLGKRWLV